MNKQAIVAAGVYSREETAALMGVHRGTVDAWRRRGLLPTRRVGRRVYFLGSDILTALKERGK